MRYTKQDLIILAVLCNLVVLALILATANQVGIRAEERPLFSKVHRDDNEAELSRCSAASETSVSFDEIDRLLEDYIPEVEEPCEEVRPLKKEKASKTPSKKKSKQERFYTIQSGDNPWKIAKKFQISYERLLELNGLDQTKARNLKIGQKLLIEEAS